jgi:hypothetical protein
LIDQTPLQPVPENEHQRKRYRHRQERIEVKAAKKLPRDVGAHHHEGTVRQVNDVQNAPHQAEAQGGNRQDPAGQHAVDEILEEELHLGSGRPAQR